MPADADNALPAITRTALADSDDHLQMLNLRIENTEQCFDWVVEASPNAKRIMKVRGIGPQTATAVLASIGKGEQFDNGRDFAAWLGLIPKQYFTGGKPLLGRMSKRGDKYLRTLLVRGARSCCRQSWR